MILGPISGSILGQDRIKRGQDGPKNDIKSLEGPKILHLQKTLRNLRFVKVFGGQRPSKAASEGQVPVELQDLKEKVSKNGPEFYDLWTVLEPFWGQLWSKKLSKN